MLYEDEKLYKIDTKVMRPLLTAKLGKVHLAYLDHAGMSLRTLCDRRAYGPGIKRLDTVNVLGAVMTPPCKRCLHLALKDAPGSIKEV